MNYYSPREKNEWGEMETFESEETSSLMDEDLPGPSSPTPSKKPSPFFKYLIHFFFYFLFLEVVFFSISMEMGHEKILFFAFLISLVDPLKDYLQRKHLIEERRKFLENPFALEEGILREERFTAILRESQRRPPFFTTLLFLLNLLFFLLCMIAGGTTHSEVLARFGSKINGLILIDGEYWRSISAAFLHVGPIHFIMNMLVLYLFGGFIERIFGSLAYLLIYTSSALLGMAGSLLMIPEPGAGASGALFGIIGTLLVFGFRYRQWIPLRFRDLYTWILCCYVILDFMIAFSVTRFDVYAHLGGLICGILLSFILDIHPKIKAFLFGFTHPRPLWKRIVIFVGSYLSALLILFSLTKALQNAYSPRQLHKDIPLASYEKVSIGLKMAVPQSWKIDGYSTPLMTTWKSPCGHYLTLIFDRAESLSPSEELSRMILDQIPRGLQKEVELTPLPERTLFSYHPKWNSNEILRWQIFKFYSPFQSGHLPTSAWIAVFIRQGYMYILKLQVFEPLKFTSLFQRILHSMDFSLPFRFDIGQQEFERLLKERKKDPFLLNQYSWFLAKTKKDLNLALKLAQKAHALWIKITKQPDPAIIDTLGETLFQLQRYSEALQWFEKAKTLAPNTPYFEKQYEKTRRALEFMENTNPIGERLDKNN